MGRHRAENRERIPKHEKRSMFLAPKIGSRSACGSTRRELGRVIVGSILGNEADGRVTVDIIRPFAVWVRGWTTVPL